MAGTGQLMQLIVSGAEKFSNWDPPELVELMQLVDEAVAIDALLQVTDPVLPSMRVVMPLLPENEVGTEEPRGQHLAEDNCAGGFS